MNKFVRLVTFIFVILLSSTIFAQEISRIDISKVAEGVKLEHAYNPGDMGSFDKLFLDDENATVIFKSEGRKIKEVFPFDIDSDGKNEYLISMDCGGSAAIYDLVIVKEKDGVWTSIWEDSFSMPEITLSNNKEKLSVRIKHYVFTANKPQKTEATLRFKDGAVIKTELPIR